MLRLSKTGSYAVPVVLHTLDILELLYRSESPLRMNEIKTMTRTAHSTTYRILRTLVDRGYVSQDIDGRFGVKDSGNAKIVRILEDDRWSSLHRTQESEATLSADQLIEILLAILQNLRRGNSTAL
jgi:DNA-binding MarR family transcriptional regulator